MVDTYALYRRLAAYPHGRRLFSLVFEQAAPYFRTSRPRFVELRPNYAELRIAKRRRVQNHIGTVHVIAICNGLEAAMGALAEASIPPGRRWIPKGMAVDYTAKATSDITCVAETTRSSGPAARPTCRCACEQCAWTGPWSSRASSGCMSQTARKQPCPAEDRPSRGRGVGAQPRRLARSASVSSVVQPCSCSHPVAPPKRSAMTWRMRAIVSARGRWSSSGRPRRLSA